MKLPRIALLCVLLICLAMTGHQLRRPILADFQVYDTAAMLVVHHHSRDMYDDADTGVDPQIRFSAPDTLYAQTARQNGIDRIRLYVYPPILADMLTPVALLPESAASDVWLLINLAALFLIIWMTARILTVPLMSWGGLALALGLLLLFSTGMALIWGQVTILLLLLWTIGLYAYSRDRKEISALALALATAIKLTPLMVIVPLFFWGDWKWLRSYLLSTIAIVGVMFAVNGGAVVDYAAHVMPSMSGGVPNLENKSLVSSVELVYVALHHQAVRFETMIVPHGPVVVAKVFSLVVGVAVLVVLSRAGRTVSPSGRLLAMALVALVSTCISPVSWKHAYVVEFLPLALLWAQAIRRPISLWQLGFLTICSIELGSFFFDSIAIKLVHGVPLALESFLAPLCGIALAIYYLRPKQLEGFRYEA